MVLGSTLTEDMNMMLDDAYQSARKQAHVEVTENPQSTMVSGISTLLRSITSMSSISQTHVVIGHYNRYCEIVG